MLIAAPLALPHLSIADEIELKMEGSFTEAENEGTRTRSFTTDFLVKSGEETTYDVPSYNGALKLAFQVNKLEDDTAFIDLKIIHEQNGESSILAEPKLMTNFDNEAKIQIGHEGGKFYTLAITPVNRHP